MYRYPNKWIASGGAAETRLGARRGSSNLPQIRAKEQTQKPGSNHTQVTCYRAWRRRLANG